MTAPSIGSLFSGAGALCELAVAPLLGGRVVWHCEYEPPSKKNPKPAQAAARVLAHRFPDTPNLGDITAVDWASVEPVEVLAGGFPCTDVSTAGQGAGLRPDTRSGLWSHMAYAISVLRPRLVVIENVRGLASSPAHSDVEPCSWCLGDEPSEPLRALGAVLGDLADLGYDAAWCGLRASDVGACHNRFRFVILAAPADTPVPRWAQLEPVDVGDHVRQADGLGPAEPGRRGGAPADADGTGRVGSGLPGADLRGVNRPAAGRDDREPLLPTPRATDGVKGGPNQRGSSGDLMLPSVVSKLLPTPKANDARGTRTSVRAKSEYGSGPTLTDAVWLLPTPTAARYGNNQSPSPGAAVRPSLDSLAADLAVDWGVYAPAIRQHEQWLGRPAPHPTITGSRGGKKLNPQLSEWMMGWPAGWVTDVPGLTPNDALQVCGNGVVPQQMVAGIRYLLPLLAEGRCAA